MIGHLAYLALNASYNARASFRQGLNDAGYLDGRDVRIAFRSADEQAERLPELAADLVRSRVAVIVAMDAPALHAAQAASTIPIVFVTGADPVQSGLVASLNKPGGNMTGALLLASEIIGKQLDLLRQVGPQAAAFGYLSQYGIRTSEEITSDIVESSRALGTELVVAEARSRSDIETAFATFVQRGTGGLVVGPYMLFETNQNRVLELARRNKIPGMFGSGAAVS
jgi:putative tryptophan/tyrosine transport system substrate-binding protein